ncbi:hypothetical protein C8R43DRAFT_1135616 [Mycena crocata]|nr:hypothetical protein C8R43DRAFT_1135616 [Mycena crocata]
MPMLLILYVLLKISNLDLYPPTLESLCILIHPRSVPIPLKIFWPLYPDLQVLDETRPDTARFGGQTFGEELPSQAVEDTPVAEAGKDETAEPTKSIGTIEELRAPTKECSILLIMHNAEPDTFDLPQDIEIIDVAKW